mmetsp:Transcript_22031/g.52897  ORF Transcript_22031/g.52897 Transcript_22031/m.52897 type:complete len:121 (+) Transcript_22031:72-434(+)
MPRYYCDYCDAFLTHDSPSVRKQHNSGRKHRDNVKDYFAQFVSKQAQSIIDDIINRRLAGITGGAGAAPPMQAPPAGMPPGMAPGPPGMGMAPPFPGGMMPPMGAPPQLAAPGFPPPMRQ